MARKKSTGMTKGVLSGLQDYKDEEKEEEEEQLKEEQLKEEQPEQEEQPEEEKEEQAEEQPNKEEEKKKRSFMLPVSTIQKLEILKFATHNNLSDIVNELICQKFEDVGDLELFSEIVKS